MGVGKRARLGVAGAVALAVVNTTGPALAAPARDSEALTMISMNSSSTQATTLPPEEQGRSRFEVVAREAREGLKDAEIVVEAADAMTGRALPVRVVVTASDGTHPDGSGHGTYADGRFFADGAFTVLVPPGRTEIALRAGPNYVPLTITTEAAAARRLRLRATLYRWFSPEERGWYGGDSHVHTQHDRAGVVRTTPEYTALQGRAQGLSYISQASKGSADVDPEPLSTESFLFRNAAELGGGPFVGHLITPGIARQLPAAVTARAFHGPLPVQNLLDPVHALGGIVTYTHPLAPPHQLHWMGATEAYSDAVLGRCADAFDIDSRATEQLWFALLNLGNRVAASSYTDSALERKNTLSPGDRRVYGQAREFTFPAMVAALREGRTFATNGGPVFPFFTVGGRGPGEVVRTEAGRSFTARAEIHSLYPLRSVEIYRRGRRAHAFPVTGRKGGMVLTYPFSETAASWYLLRVEDERGNWAITSPVYFAPEAADTVPSGSAVLLEISNNTRMIELRRDFFAHLIVTVSREDRLAEVELLKDGKVVRQFTPGMGDSITGQTPVTGGKGEYSPGWLWHPAPARPAHFQADWSVKETGWYEVRATTAQGKTLRSDAIRFDAANPNSHELSVAHLSGPDFRLTRWGYGEEMPLEQIKIPFEGDHWWYPAKSFWRLTATFGQETRELGGGDAERGKASFRRR